MTSATIAAFRRAAIDFSKRVITHPWFEPAIISLIVLNAALLGLQTYPGFKETYGETADRLDVLVIAIFVVEIVLKITAMGFRFFGRGWNWFDLIVILISLAPATSSFSILRAARILRLLRLLSIVPKMRRVIGGFFGALPGMAGVLGVLSIIFYVSAVAATTVFGQSVPDPLPDGVTPDDIAAVQALFGSLGASFFTLFQLMTLENWADGIVVPTLNVYPAALWFFIPFIVLTSFAVLNLFIGIIVDSMQDEEREAQAERDAQQDEARSEAIAALQARMDEQFEARGPVRDVAAEERQAVVTATILEELRALRAEVAALKQRP